MRKYYDVSEAEDLIPLLKPRIVNLVKLNSAINFLESVDIQYDDEYETIKQDVLMNKKFHDYSLKFCREVENLLKIGVVLRDVENGVVNFFSLHGGKEIFLCWKLGEHKIDSWYEVGSDYEFRKPLRDLKGKRKI
ncbi:DUF2203 family protein [Candidatus Woesearchaeota archaeon]|nr:DUF2203 family protein [Candidatus Woesearchaeota archaeon]